VSGSTAGKPDNFSTFCGDTFAGGQEISDQVLELLILQGCTLSLELSSDWNAVLGLRNEGLCLDEPPLQSFCVNSTNGAGTETFKRHMPSGRYHVIVDGAAGEQAGAFSLDVECAAPACGDGVLNPGEQCDNGPDIPNDGCSAACTVEAQVAGDSCAAPTVISIDAGQEAFWPSSAPFYNNSTAGDDAAGTCGEPLGRDHVFAITPTASGLLTVTVGQGYAKETLCNLQPSPNEFCWEHLIHVRTGNCANGPQLLCANMSYTTFATVAQFAVTAGTTYYVFVDGYTNEPWAQGPYVMRLNHTPN
jgi:cysteine-rich repeat protein